MSAPDDEFLALLRSTFRIEAAEHLQAIASGLLELEKAAGPDLQRAIERVFRAAHTLKGAARAVEFTEIEGLCQSMEEVFSSWKRGHSAPSSDVLDTLHRALDTMAAMLSEPAASKTLDVHAGSASRLSLHHAEAAPAPSPAPEVVVPPSAQPVTLVERPAAPIEVTVRVPVGKLEAQLLQAEEVLTAKLTAGQRAVDLRDLAGALETWRRAWASIEPDIRELRQSSPTPAAIKRVLDFLDRALERLKSIESSATALSRVAEHDRHSVGKLVDDLLDNSKRLLLLPFATISASFPKLVRDLSRDQGKEADLAIYGDDVQIDKRILEEIKDSIVHLLRNSIDHGIEMPDERVRRGKPARATIIIALSQVDGNKVQLLLSDDGEGININKVKESAVRHGMLTTEDADRLSEGEAQRLIFVSEVSTSPMITQVSGRGLGLAIVQEKAEKLGGEVTVESHPGKGTTFRMVIPSTRATFRGILIEAGGQLLVVPTAQVESVGRTRPADVQTVQGRDTISFEGRVVPLVRLADALEMPASQRDDLSTVSAPVIVVCSGDHRVAFVVDAVLDEQEVLVKPLRKPLARVRNIAGATVLASGRVAPILNVADLVKSARRVRRATAGTTIGPTAAPAPKSILVAEDSITSRMLLKSILESAGYKVKTAIDGMDAFTMLRAEHFDLVVSDVEMPRLNGFDLTARIRADQKLTDLPVVLVTALETREDRERGVDAGANAYIIKGSFDQSNLLEAVRRLI